MVSHRNAVVVATASYIPGIVIPNSFFSGNTFYTPDGQVEKKPTEEIIAKLTEITSIRERRYAPKDMVASDMVAESFRALDYDLESLDEIIVAHNFGDIDVNGYQPINVPPVAAKAKLKAGIKNPSTFAVDVIGGCPGGIQAMILAQARIKNGGVDRIAVAAAEILSRVSDPHDKDSMIYSDGAAVVVFEAITSGDLEGILTSTCRTDADFSDCLRVGASYNPNYSNPNRLFLKMEGNRLFKYAVKNVPGVIVENLIKGELLREKKEGESLRDYRAEVADAIGSNLKMILAHQANEKLDVAILEKLGLSEDQIDRLAPMTIDVLGNSSVATVPTLLDKVLKGEMDGFSLSSDELINLFSVGAGMNINSLIYRAPR